MGQSATQDVPGAPGAFSVPSRGKYGNRSVSLDGYVFASQAEGRRYLVLRHRQDIGEIVGLRCHPSWNLIVHGEKIGRYTADFSYAEASDLGTFIVEDVKSGPTRTTAYLLRKKLMWALYGIKVQEIL